MKELFRICVGRYGMDADYFLQRATIFEINEFLAGADLRERDEWIRARHISFITAKVGGCEAETEPDFFPLPWDDEERIDERQAIDREEESERLRVLRQKAKQMEEKENGRNN